MRKLTVSEKNGDIQVSEHQSEEWHTKDGINIDFILNKKNMPRREYLQQVSDFSENIEWIKKEGEYYNFQLNKIKEDFSIFSNCSWMKGEAQLKPEIEDGISETETIVSFSITEEEISKNYPKKIFLSHKGANKPLVREYCSLLKELGFDPWLDEDAMVAGSNLNREILAGFKDSCAAVFFITPEFKDEYFLAEEIDYAIDEKRNKRDKFAIITLALGESGEKHIIPELLNKYVYKEPATHLEGFREVIRALPLSSGEKKWKK